jgi:hypothetical protein
MVSSETIKAMVLCGQALDHLGVPLEGRCAILNRDQYMALGGSVSGWDDLVEVEIEEGIPSGLRLLQ